MPFTPRYQALFASAIVAQAIALLERDFAGAIALQTPPPTRKYPAFQEYRKNLVAVAINTPSIVVAARQTTFLRPDDLGTRPQEHKILLRPEIEDQDPQFVAAAAYDYLRAVDQVMTSATLADWEQPLAITHPTAPSAETVGLAATGGHVLDVFVEDHDYGVLWETPKGFGMRPGLTLAVTVEEI